MRTSRRQSDRQSRRQSGRQSESRAPRKTFYRQLRSPITPQTVFSEDRVADLHETALRLLEELGIQITHPEARTILEKAGARLDGDMVYFGREMVAEAIKTAPKVMPLATAHPDREVVMGDGHVVFTSAGGCPNVYDRVRGRRPGDAESYIESVKLVHSFDILHKQPVAPEPQDVPVEIRHLFTTMCQLKYSDKAIGVYARGTGQTEQSFALIQEGLGLDDDSFRNRIWVSTVINSNSPRVLDDTMAQGLIDFARYKQMTIITPFCLSGAMAPITMEGALILSHAESLMGITLTQMTNPGAPITYGSFSSNVDLKSGSPAFGTPEHMKLQIGAGQLARYIGIPWRSAAGSAANLADAQGAQENLMALWGAMQGGANLVLHATGWLEGGLTVGFEKMMTDLDALQMIGELCAKVEENDLDDVLADIASVQPGGHFFSSPATMERFTDAFYEPLVADLSNHGTWQAAGGLDAETRATAIWQDKLAQYQQPEICKENAARAEPLMEKFKAAGGAKPVS